MEIKKGYKSTELGMLPDDWNVKTISAFSKPVRGGSPRPAGDPKYFNGNYIPWLTVAALTNIPLSEIFVTETVGFLTEEGSKHSRILDKNTIIIANSGATLGVAKILGVKCCANDGIAALIDFDSNTCKSFVVHFINSKITYLREVVATGNGQPNLNTELIGNIKIPHPPLPEQQAISEVLSNTDNLIQALEKQIDKKRSIKQGVMQELLTPKAGWVEQSIFQLAENKKELFDDGDWIESEHITDKGIRLIQTGNIGIGTFIEKENRKYIYKESFEKLGCKELIVGDLLICRLAEPAGRACIFPNIGEEKVITSVDVTIFRPKTEIANRQFLNQIFASSIWFNSISDLCGGTTHKRISRGALGRIKILLPDVEEQSRIATILFNMDKEINELEIKLGKFRKLKLGLMQNLLTGKIRLIES